MNRPKEGDEGDGKDEEARAGAKVMNRRCKSALTALAATALFGTCSQVVLACSCGREASLAEIIGASRKDPAVTIFSGRVVKVQVLAPGGLLATSHVTFDVDRVWKGSIRRTTVVNNGTGSCTANFEKGRLYLVYTVGHLTSEPAILTTNQCTLTKRLSAAKSDLLILGEGKRPPGSPPTVILMKALITGAAMALGVGAIVVSLMRRHNVAS